MKAALLAVPLILLGLPRGGVRAGPPTVAPKLDEPVRAFLAGHCWDCHAGETPKGGFDVGTLAPDFADATKRDRWLPGAGVVNHKLYHAGEPKRLPYHAPAAPRRMVSAEHAAPSPSTEQGSRDDRQE